MSPFVVKDWRDRPDQTTPVDAAGLEDLETRLGRSGSANTVDADVLSSPVDDLENAFVVKSSSATWGTGAYGTGQAFMLLKQGSGAVEPDDSVLWRVDEDGDTGIGGGIHVATDLRKDTGDPASTQAIWIEPAADMVHIVLDPVASQSVPLMQWLTPGSAVKRGEITGIEGNIVLWNDDATDTILNLYSTTAGKFGTRAILKAGAPGTIGLFIQGASGQTANLIDLRNSANATQFAIGPAGQPKFFGSAGAAKQTVSGSRGLNDALASLLTALSNYGLITDSTTA